jgi:phospholipase D-like protein
VVTTDRVEEVGGDVVLFDGVAGLLFLALWIFCIVDVITTTESQVRNLPKIVWLIIVVLLVDIGSIAWLVAGRTWGANAGTPISRNVRSGSADRWAAEASAPQQTARRKPSNPDDDEEFLAHLRARAEEQRRRARETEQGPGEVPPESV